MILDASESLASAGLPASGTSPMLRWFGVIFAIAGAAQKSED
jgi:hypothetical protein